MEADLILSGGTVITMDDRREIFPEGAVVVKGNAIAAVGPAADLAGRYEAKEVLDCTGQVVIPGLVNAHTHAPMSLLRGLADDLRPELWLHGYMLPVEREFVSSEFCYWGTLLSCAEMIRSGVTCFADMYYYEDEVARAIAEAGMRAVCAETLMKLSTPDAASYDEGLDRCRRFIERWKDHELIIPAIGPYSSYMCTPELLVEAARLAKGYDVPLLIHLSESKEEVEESYRLNGCGPVAYVDRYGVLEVKAVAAHCVHVSQEEMELMARRGTGVVHNPTSNLKLANGIADVKRMLDLGLRVGLGTDGPVNNNDQDMFEEMRLAALLAKGITGDPTAVPAQVALAMATIGGAFALHMEDIIGSIEVGKRADLAVIDLDEPHVMPRFTLSDENLYGQLVYAAKSADVCHVVVDGKLLMRDRELLTVDLDAVRAEAQRIADGISTFLIHREEDLLGKLVTIGGLKEHETFEVQVKVRLKEELPIEEVLARPDIDVWKPTIRDQYDTYLLFEGKGWIRYREDYVLKGEEIVQSIYSLTLAGPAERKEYGNSVLLSRSRFTSPADRSLRFYLEYFKPDATKEVNKRRRRWHIGYKGVEFAINLDELTKPVEGTFLEIKARTWSKNDAIYKARLIGELLEIFGVEHGELLKQDYVEL